MAAKWIPYESTCKTAVAIYYYENDHPKHLRLIIGDIVQITEHIPGWYLGYRLVDPSTMGIFPKSYVSIQESDLYPRVAIQLQDWIKPLKELFLSGENDKFHDVIKLVETIHTENKKLHSDVHTTEELRKIQSNLCDLLARGEKLLSLPVVVRDEDFRPVNPLIIPSVQLYKSHVKIQDRLSTATHRDGSRMKTLFSMIVKIDELVTNLSMGDLEVVVFLTTATHRISQTCVIRQTSQASLFNKFKQVAFTDLSTSHEAHIYLIFHVVRIGIIDLRKRMGRKTLTMNIKRPYGVGVLDITDIFNPHTSSDKDRINIPFYLPVNEESLHTLQLKAMTNAPPKCEKEGTMHLRFIKCLPFDCNQLSASQWNTEPVARSILTDKESHRCQNVVVVTLVTAETDKGTKKAEKNLEATITLHDNDGKQLSFTDPTSPTSMPSTFKSVVYYHSDRPRWNEQITINLPKEDSSIPRNLHLRIILKHRSMEEAKDSRIKPYGVAYLSLLHTGTGSLIVADGSHALNVHKMEVANIEKSAYLKLPMKNLETGSSSSRRIFGTQVPKDICTVETVLLSPVHTNNESVHKVLNWQQNLESIQNCLVTRFVHPQYVKDTELKQFGKHILDSLLNILSSSVDENDELASAVFQALLHFFHIAGHTHSDITQQYLTGPDFTVDNIHNKLLLLLHKELTIRHQSSPNQLQQKPFSKILWFFKVIVRSKKLEEQKLMQSGTRFDHPETNPEKIFERHVDTLLTTIYTSGSRLDEDPVLMGIVFKHIGEIIDDLIEVYSPDHLTNHIIRLIEKSADSDAPKENILCDVINSQLVQMPSCRNKLLPTIAKHLVEFFTKNVLKDLEKTVSERNAITDRGCDILLSFVTRLGEVWSSSRAQGDIEIPGEVFGILGDEEKCGLLRKLSRLLIRCLYYDPRFNIHTVTVISSLGCIVIGLLQHMSELWPRFVSHHFLVTSLIHTVLPQRSSYPVMRNQMKPTACPVVTRGLESGDPMVCRCATCISLSLVELSDVLGELLQLFYEMCSRDIFPGGGAVRAEKKSQPWMDMLFLQSHQILATLRCIFNTALQPYFMTGIINIRGTNAQGLEPTHPLSEPLIHHFRECIEAVGSQTHLHYESLPVAVRNRQLEVYPDDLRWTACILLRELWMALGVKKEAFIPSFVGTVLKMALAPLRKIRRVCVDILFDMMSLNLRITELDLISELDRVMEMANQGFVDDMKFLFNDRRAKDRGQADLVSLVCKQMHILLEYSRYVNDESRINGMLAINNLRNYYLKIGRQNMYLRYLYKLVKLHEECDNIAEQGYTLHVISQHLQWTDECVDRSEVSEKYVHLTTHRELKEQLCRDSLDCLKVYDWEMAIEVCKELIYFYESIAFDYLKLSEILDCQSKLHRQIIQDNTRMQSNYYLIRYYGDGYPSFIASEDGTSSANFIFRSTEKLSDVVDLVIRQFPDATRLTKQPDEDQMRSGGTLKREKSSTINSTTGGQMPKSFFVGGVVADACLPDHFTSNKINPRIRTYYEQNQVKEFHYRRNLVKTEKITEMYSEIYHFQISEQLPSVLSLVPVVYSKKEDNGPLKTALYGLRMQYKKLSNCLEQYELKMIQDNQFVGELRGTVDAKVGGGLMRYLELHDILDEESNDSSALVDCLVDFLTLQHRCLTVWKPIESLQFKEHLVNEFDQQAQHMTGYLDVLIDLSVDHIKADMNQTLQRPKEFQKVQSATTPQRSNTNNSVKRTSFRQSVGSYNFSISTIWKRDSASESVKQESPTDSSLTVSNHDDVEYDNSVDIVPPPNLPPRPSATLPPFQSPPAPVTPPPRPALTRTATEPSVSSDVPPPLPLRRSEYIGGPILPPRGERR